MFRFVAALAIACLCGTVLVDAQGDYKMLFGQQEAKAAGGSPDDAAAFAASLLKGAKATGDQKDLQLLLCRKAYEYGLKGPSGYPTAMEAARLLARLSPDTGGETRMMMLEVMQLTYSRSAPANRKRLGEELVAALVAAGDQAVKKNPSEAVALYRRALGVAGGAAPERRREILEKIQKVGSALEDQRRLAGLKAAVEARSDDVRARVNLILAYLGEFDDPAEAAKLVTGDLDESMRTYLPLTPKPLSELSEGVCLELAGWYLALGEKTTPANRRVLLERSDACCRRYLEIHKANDKLRLKATAFQEQVLKAQAQDAVAGMARTMSLDLGRGVSMKLVLISPGKFIMGSPKSETHRMPHEGPQHEVIITRPFYMGIYEVTHEQYVAIMGSHKSVLKGASLPIDNVSWEDAVEFCRRVSARTGKTVRLPTEAEWEYACRAGTTTMYSFGDDPKLLRLYGWYHCPFPQPVGQKRPNPWGLYDMHGNLLELCSDWFGPYPDETVRDPQGPPTGRYKVGRGGYSGWLDYACRSASRLDVTMNRISSTYGIRVVVSADRD